MSFRVILHPRARVDLLQLRDAISDLGGGAASRRILQAIEAVISGPADVPLQCSVRDEVTPGLRSIPAAGKGVVSFVVDDGARVVRVVAVTYGGQDWFRRERV